MSDISEEYISSIVKKVASTVDLKTWQYTIDKFENVAQNYFGIIVPVVLVGECKGDIIEIPLVLKLAPIDERYRVSGAVTNFFAREIYVYKVLFNIYQQIQIQYPLPLHYKIPHCYYVQEEYCKEVIVMRNMVHEGFKPYTHQMFLDLDHITLSLESLAKLHALSFITQNKNPDLYGEISQTCEPLTEKTNKRYLDIMKDRLEKAIMKFEGTQYLSLLKKFKEDISTIFEYVVTKVMKTCICHRDIWKENILFKYEEDKPTSACLIDFQSVSISCAAFDVLYLIISSTATTLRQGNYYNLLDIYYKTFDNLLKEAGMESQKVYSREMFHHDLKLVAPACIITANCALWLSSGLQKEGHVRSKIVWSTGQEKDMAVSRYKEIVRGIIDDCCNYGYISL